MYWQMISKYKLSLNPHVLYIPFVIWWSAGNRWLYWGIHLPNGLLPLYLDCMYTMHWLQSRVDSTYISWSIDEFTLMSHFFEINYLHVNIVCAFEHVRDGYHHFYNFSWRRITFAKYRNIYTMEILLKKKCLAIH